MDKQLNKQEYKYTIHKRLRRMPIEEFELAMKFLPEFLNITSDTFRHWIYIKAFEGREIPASAIIKLSAFFECSPVDIITDGKEKEQFQQKAVQELWKALLNKNNVYGNL